MGQFMMTVTALVAFGARVATAQAEIGGGAPPRNAGQRCKYCARDVGGQDGQFFGSWGPDGRRARAQLRRLRPSPGFVAVAPRRTDGPHGPLPSPLPAGRQVKETKSRP
jgi:hypothetical protein